MLLTWVQVIILSPNEASDSRLLFCPLIKAFGGNVHAFGGPNLC